MKTMMRMKPALLAATSFLLMACLCNPLSHLPSSPEPSPGLGASFTPASVIENDSFTIVRLLPIQGELKELLEEHAQSAIAQGRQPVIMFDAEW